jgi:hypothetical protein
MSEPRATDPRNSRYPTTALGAAPGDHGGGGGHFAAPLGSWKNGRLRFRKGAHRAVIRAGSHLQGLYRASFGDRMPTVGVRRGIVTILYPRIPADDWLDCRSERLAEVELNARIPWDIEVRGGASRLVADLRGLRLGAFSVNGGASRLEVVLPAPSGTVVVVILGGASNVAIQRPNGIAARLRVSGGATNMKFDDRRIGASGGELNLKSRNYEVVTDRYDIAVTGGANNLSVDNQRLRKEGVYLDREGE